MSYTEGTNYQARKEDEGKPMFDTVKLVNDLTKQDVQSRLNGKKSLEDKMEIVKLDMEAYRQSKISWGKLLDTIRGLMQITNIHIPEDIQKDADALYPMKKYEADELMMTICRCKREGYIQGRIDAKNTL